MPGLAAYQLMMEAIPQAPGLRVCRAAWLMCDVFQWPLAFVDSA